MAFEIFEHSSLSDLAVDNIKKLCFLPNQHCQQLQPPTPAKILQPKIIDLLFLYTNVKTCSTHWTLLITETKAIVCLIGQHWTLQSTYSFFSWSRQNQIYRTFEDSEAVTWLWIWQCESGSNVVTNLTALYQVWMSLIYFIFCVYTKTFV